MDKIREWFNSPPTDFYYWVVIFEVACIAAIGIYGFLTH